MEIISIEEGKCGLPLRFTEVASLSGVYLPDIITAIAQRYVFMTLPDTSPEAIQKNGLEFTYGRFYADEKEYNIRSLNVFHDGILANCYSTEEAVLLLKDLLAWAKKELEFRVPDTAFSRLHIVSTLVVRFDNDIVNAFNKFNGVFAATKQILASTYDLDVAISVAHIAWDYDRSTVAGSLAKLPSFVVERQLDQPDSSNRFFCQAPIHTQEHIRLLETFEDALRD